MIEISAILYIFFTILSASLIFNGDWVVGIMAGLCALFYYYNFYILMKQEFKG